MHNRVRVSAERLTESPPTSPKTDLMVQTESELSPDDAAMPVVVSLQPSGSIDVLRDDLSGKSLLL